MKSRFESVSPLDHHHDGLLRLFAAQAFDFWRTSAVQIRIKDFEKNRNVCDKKQSQFVLRHQTWILSSSLSVIFGAKCFAWEENRAREDNHVWSPTWVISCVCISIACSSSTLSSRVGLFKCLSCKIDSSFTETKSWMLSRKEPESITKEMFPEV